MPATFDPYRDWLKIPVGKRPLSYYSLLGVADFEPRADVIHRAFELRVAELMSVAHGPHVDQARKIIGEVEAARTCLLNSDSKLRYDTQLRKIVPAPAPPRAAVAPPVAAPPVTATSTPSTPGITDLDLKLLESMAAESAAMPVIQQAKQRRSIDWDAGAAGINRGIMAVFAIGITLVGMMLGLVAGRNLALAAAELPVWHQSADDLKEVAAAERGRELVKADKEDTIDRLSVKYMAMFATACITFVVVGGYYLLRY